jgi:hypothetical protein
MLQQLNGADYSRRPEESSRESKPNESGKRATDFGGIGKCLHRRSAKT